MPAERVLVTGASGFIGPHVVARLREEGYLVRVTQRRAAPVTDRIEAVITGDLAAPTDWRPALEGVRHVVHLAGLAHAGPGLDEALYQRINTQATLELARAAEAAGIARFVYLSSIKAQIGNVASATLSEADEPRPDEAYGRSKLAAEQGLAGLALDWVALRPVLVYGPGVKANMAALLKLAQLPVPLPLGDLSVPRSLVAVENLAEAVAFALTPPCPTRRSFIVSDPEPISVAQMIAAMREGLGRRPGLVSVPAGLLRLAALALGKGDAFAKLSGGLVARPAALLKAGWQPPAETAPALARLAASACAG